MKIFEKIIKDEIMSLVSGKLDPLQFAYQTGKGVDDAKLFLLDTMALIYQTSVRQKTCVKWTYAHFNVELGIYQFERERRLR